MIKGIIFDMDGVISDTQRFHSKVESELLARFGINLSSEEITQKYAGVRTKYFFDQLLKQQTEKYNLDSLIKEKWQKIHELAKKSVDEIPGAINLIKVFYENGFPLAVASASDFKYVDSVLTILEVKKYFKAVITGDMVLNCKPDPEIFLLAASKISINPEDCLVIEDGFSGMEAAKRAKMKCIGLVKDKNKKYPTQNLVLSLSEITLGYLNQLK